MVIILQYIHSYVKHIAQPIVNIPKFYLSIILQSIWGRRKERGGHWLQMNVPATCGSSPYYNSCLILGKSVHFLALVFCLLNENLNPTSLVLLSANINRLYHI